MDVMKAANNPGQVPFFTHYQSLSCVYTWKADSVELPNNLVGSIHTSKSNDHFSPCHMGNWVK